MYKSLLCTPVYLSSFSSRQGRKENITSGRGVSLQRKRDGERARKRLREGCTSLFLNNIYKSKKEVEELEREREREKIFQNKNRIRVPVVTVSQPCFPLSFSVLKPGAKGW